LKKGELESQLLDVEEELAEGKVMLKNMTTGEQKLVTPVELVAEVQ